MAELGTIESVDLNRGIRPVDRSADTQLLGTALSAMTKVIEEGVKATVTKDLVDAIDEVADDNLVNPLPPLDPNEATLAQSLDRWKIQAEQGNASQRTLAEMRIKEVLVEAQTRYPWMAEKLQARAGMVVSASYELDKLGLLDAARRTQADQAQSNIDKIVDYGQLPWDKGGLGISPTVPVGSDQFIREYQILDQARQGHDANVRNVSMTLARAEATATELESAIISTLQGQASVVRASRHDTFSRNGVYAAMQEAQKGDAADLTVLQQFQDGGVPNVILELELTKQEMIQFHSAEFSGRLAGTQAAGRAKAVLDDFIAEQDSIISLFKTAADQMPTSLEYVETLNTIRGHDIMRGLSTPARNAMTMLGMPGSRNLIELAKLAPTVDSLQLLNGISGLAVGTLNSLQG